MIDFLCLTIYGWRETRVRTSFEMGDILIDRYRLSEEWVKRLEEEKKFQLESVFFSHCYQCIEHIRKGSLRRYQWCANWLFISARLKKTHYTSIMPSTVDLSDEPLHDGLETTSSYTTFW